jgi:RimJ/RimL family protein N-acetyltransferase
VQELSFRLMTRADLPLLHEWLQRPHVRRWWRDRETWEQVESHYGPALDGDEPTDHYLIVLDGRPIGMIQTYLAADYADEWPIGAEPGIAGVDIVIGEEELTGQGLGPRVLRTFVDEIVFADPSVVACVAGPDVRNARSIRAFENAGFRRTRVVELPAEEAPEQLLRLDRLGGELGDERRGDRDE